MDKTLQALRIMQYGQGFGGVLRGMYRQVIPVQAQVAEAPVVAPIVEADQIGEGKRKRKRKRVYKAPPQPHKKKSRKRKGSKKSSRKSFLKKFQLPVQTYNF
ncbi:MAG: hypothetical protein FD143_3422 [Ignavibacteria bacterium]|nr:MAG: hypothetical protein FD143_3422 [Ignavibacteria bacterium]